MQLDEFQIWFNKGLFEFIDARIGKYEQFTNRDAILDSLTQVRALAQGGKRIRPYLAYLSYRAQGGRNVESVQSALIAIELFHVFCLIHDDIIDEDDMRRGTLTVHARMGAYYANMGRAHIATRAGNAQALLAGDLVFAWVFELFAPYFTHGHVLQEFLYTVDEVVVGQMIDVDLMAQSSATRQGILDKMRLKTAGYTFVQPLRLGRLLAGETKKDEILDAAGLALGLGFQMQDDLLDIYSTETEMGKNIGSDMEESQHTLLTQFVIDSGMREDIEELRSLMGQAMDQEKLAQAQALFERTGASEALRQDIAFQMSEAQRLVHMLSWSEEVRTPLSQLIAYVTKRTS